MNSVGLSTGPMLVRVAWHDEIADAPGVGALARRSARRVVRSSTLRSSTTLRSSSSAAAASERQRRRESTICALRVLRGAETKLHKAPRGMSRTRKACLPAGSPPAAGPRRGWHTSTRVKSTLDTHAPRVCALPAVHMLSRDNTRSRQKLSWLPCSSHWPLADRRPARHWRMQNTNAA